VLTVANDVLFASKSLIAGAGPTEALKKYAWTLCGRFCNKLVGVHALYRRAVSRSPPNSAKSACAVFSSSNRVSVCCVKIGVLCVKMINGGAAAFERARLTGDDDGLDGHVGDMRVYVCVRLDGPKREHDELLVRRGEAFEG
jgi:hypothetical protein